MHTIIKPRNVKTILKIITLAPTCFGSRRNHHQGAVLCLAKTTEYGFSVLVGIDAVNVMAVYQPVVQACTSLLFHGCSAHLFLYRLTFLLLVILCS